MLEVAGMLSAEVGPLVVGLTNLDYQAGHSTKHTSLRSPLSISDLPDRRTRQGLRIILAGRVPWQSKLRYSHRTSTLASSASAAPPDVEAGYTCWGRMRAPGVGGAACGVTPT